MFSLMGNCFSCIKRRRQPKKPLTLALLGIDDAGKTTASFSFAGEPIDQDVAPTIGFRNVKFTFDDYEITLFDVGGGKNIRPVWKNYFPEVYGVIYMVDSSSSDRMEEAKMTFRDSLEHPHVSGKPVLLLANKQDKEGALDEVDICDQLNLEAVVNMNKCPCHIEMCTALQGTGRKMDKRMREGLYWLLRMVEEHWEELKARVEADMRTVEKLRRAEAEARRERVRKQREERERQEEEERKRLGIEKKESDNDDDEMMAANPFKPLDLDELKRKEEKLKAEKKHRRELEKAAKDREANGPVYSPEDLDNASLDQYSEHMINGYRVYSTKSSSTVLPPLEPLGTPFSEENEQKQKRKKKKKKSLQDAEDIEEQWRRRRVNDDDDYDPSVLRTPKTPESQYGKSTMTISGIDFASGDESPSHSRSEARVVSPVNDGEGEVSTPRTRRVKKRKLRHLVAKLNKQKTGGGGREEGSSVMLDGEDTERAGDDTKERFKQSHMRNRGDEAGDEVYDLSSRRQFARDPRDLTVPENHASRLPRHSQLHRNVFGESGNRSSRAWGMAGDLPAVADDVAAIRKPKFTTDDDYLL